jgi:hypothetical protein
MNWRKALLTGSFVVGFALTVVPGAEAKDHRRNGYYTSAYGSGYSQCAAIDDRIRHDQAKIEEFASTGRHQKAMRWFRDDLQAAYRDMDRCENGSYARYEPRYDPRYDRSYGDDRYDPYYDPYYGRSSTYDPNYSQNGSYDPFDYDGDGRFKWKNDWPALLGLFAGAQIGQ